MTSNGAMMEYDMLIGGEWRPALAGERIVVENPADETPIATIPAGQAADAEAALDAAAAAQPAWAATPPIERAALLHALADATLREEEALARCLTREQGKPLHEARGEVGAAANFIRYAAEAARRLRGDIFPSDSPQEQLWIQRVPYGVVTAMIAWNFPLALIGRKCGPALVTGNSLVLLSHCDTPLTVLEFGKLAQEVGIPPGVLNLVTGRGREIGEALVRSPRTDMVTLTGSVRAGREVYAAAAENITTIRLELGGKAPFIILEDADIDRAAEAAVTARFANCGQVCTCNERMFVHADIYEDFMDNFVARVEQLRVGNPLTDVHLGPQGQPAGSGKTGADGERRAGRRRAGADWRAAAARWRLRARALVRADGADAYAAGYGHHARGNLRPHRARRARQQLRRRPQPGQRLRLRPLRLPIHRRPAAGDARR